jgi:hypothetical protein
MATVHLGRNAAVGIGFETTEGTAVAATRWARLASLSLNVVSTRSRIDDLSLGSTSYLKARYLEQVEVSGSLEILCYYQGGALHPTPTRSSPARSRPQSHCGPLAIPSPARARCSAAT